MELNGSLFTLFQLESHIDGSCRKACATIMAQWGVEASLERGVLAQEISAGKPRQRRSMLTTEPKCQKNVKGHQHIYQKDSLKGRAQERTREKPSTTTREDVQYAHACCGAAGILFPNGMLMNCLGMQKEKRHHTGLLHCCVRVH